MKQQLYYVFFFVLLPGLGLGQARLDSAIVVKKIDSLILVSRGLTDKKDFEKALGVNEAAKELALANFGGESAIYAKACYNQGRVFYIKKDYPEAEKRWLETAALRKKILGVEHQDYGMSLANLANLYRDVLNYSKAEPFYIESLAIIEKKQGKEAQVYANILFDLGIMYGDMGNFAKAETVQLEAMNIRAKVLGKEHADYSRSLNALAIIYSKQDNFEKAEPLYLENLAIREKTKSKDPSGYARVLNNLGNLYSAMGQYEKSESLLLEALSIRAKVLGKADPEYASSLVSLASHFQALGNYEKAETFFLEALAIREKALGQEHPVYIRNLVNLAALYFSMGNYEKAEALCIQAKDFQARVLGKTHLEYAETLNVLAGVYELLNKYKQAEIVFLESLAIQEKTVGKEHSSYLKSLSNLAFLYTDMGNFEKAEPLFLEVLSIQEKTLGKAHWKYAMNLDHLAMMYVAMGNYTKAEPLHLAVKEIRAKTLGKENADYANSLNRLARLYVDMGRPTQAIPLYDSASIIQQTLLSRALHHLSDQELQDYIRLFSGNRFLSLAQNQPDAVPTCYNNTLFYKGFLLNAYSQVKRLALSDSTTTEKFNLLKSYERRLATQYSRPIDERINVPELEEKANNLEKDLARSVSGYGEAMQQVKWQEVQQNLKAGQAAIEFVHYQHYYKTETDSTLYAALVLRPGWSAPRMVPLFEERQIQPLLAAANRVATAGQLYATRGIKQKAGGEGIVIPGKKTASLYQLIWLPIDSLLRDVRTVYFSPSGLLHRLNLGAVGVPGTDQTLADRYTLVQVGSTRQLVVQDAANPATTPTAALFGGLKYDPETPAATGDSMAQNPTTYDVAALRSALGGRGGDHWNYLPGTEKEVKNAAKLLGKAGYTVQTLSGVEGSETAFKQLGKTGHPAPKVLHVATHGFFFPDPKDSTQQRETFSDRDPVFKTSDNPLLRSGLVLAGANPAWAGAKTPEGQEDGILTAYEISQLNLSGTELVVLSACETGLGDVEDNEGVYGLKRAFKIAGAKYLIMSLWQVPDQQSQELMSVFYKNWLEEKMEIPAAFSAAQQAMRQRYKDPINWAGFVLVE